MTTCAKCNKKITEPVQCLNCNELFCSRQCQIKSVKTFHKRYCNKSPRDFILNTIEQVEYLLKAYCYLMRQIKKSNGDLYLTSEKLIMNPRNKVISIAYGDIPDSDCPKSSNPNEYIIYVKTADYRGYFKYAMDVNKSLDEIADEDLPGKMVLNLRTRTIFYQ